MKILLAAGVFYPDVGGPAIHVRKIAEKLSSEGVDVQVLAYGDDPEKKEFPFVVHRVSRKYGTLMQWFLYSIYALRFTLFSDLVYAFDPTAAGLPAAIASAVCFKPFIIRIGGDPIWEREAELGRRVMPITEYYEKGLYMEDKPTLFKLIRFVLRRAKVIVFYNTFWVDFYTRYFGIDSRKMRIVKNPVFRRESANPVLAKDPAIIFAGRFVIYKNLERVISAFDDMSRKIGKGKLLLIGKGPEEAKLRKLVSSLGLEKKVEFIESLPQEKLFEKVRESAIAIGPALSEFNPNFILESLSFGKPVILSKGHGLSVDLPEEFLFDPLSQSEFERKLEYLFDSENYRKAVDTVNGLDMSQTWEKVLDFHSALVKEFAK